MNNIFVLPSLAALAVVGTSLSAHAQTATPVEAQQLTESSATVLSSNQENTEPGTQIQEFSAGDSVSQTTESQQFPSVNTENATNRIITPVPGTVATTSSTLAPESVEPTSQGGTTQAPASTIAQTDIDPGRPTRGGRSYLGIGANIGISGDDSSLSDGNFTVISKIGLTNAFSVRPSAIFGNDTTILVPVTYDFNLQAADAFSEPLAIAPYVGVGAAITTGDGSEVGFLASGGIDFPLSTQFTATAAVNAAFFGDTDIGLLIGVGYNFSGF